MRESAHSGVHTTLHIAEYIKLKEQGFQFRHFLLLLGGVILGYLSFSIWKNKGSKDYLLRVQEGWGNLRDYLVWFLVQRRSSNPKSSSGPILYRGTAGGCLWRSTPSLGVYQVCLSSSHLCRLALCSLKQQKRSTFVLFRKGVICNHLHLSQTRLFHSL